MKAPIIEGAEYMVKATLEVWIAFAAIERSTPLTNEDAVANAIGTMQDGFWDLLRDEGWSISFSAEREGE